MKTLPLIAVLAGLTCCASGPKTEIGTAIAITRCSPEEIVLTSLGADGTTGCNVEPGQVLVLVGECTDSGWTVTAHNGRTYCFDVDF